MGRGSGILPMPVDLGGTAKWVEEMEVRGQKGDVKLGGGKGGDIDAHRFVGR